MRMFTCLTFGLLMGLTGCAHDYRSDTSRILSEDEIKMPNSGDIEEHLTAHIRECCQHYKCTPDQFLAGARRLQAVMKLSDPNATLSAAASQIPADRSSLDDAVNSIISGYKSLR